jgi:hypothetical protein
MKCRTSAALSAFSCISVAIERYVVIVVVIGRARMVCMQQRVHIFVA